MVSPDEFQRACNLPQSLPGSIRQSICPNRHLHSMDARVKPAHDGLENADHD
jgi:hypothetical protein